MAKQIKGRNGGTLIVREKGDPVTSPNVGRKRNVFREAIQAVAEGGVQDVVLSGYLVDDDGTVTKERVKVSVTLPSVQAVVQKMFRKAGKGDVPAAKWLTETGYGKTLNLGEDPDNPIGGGFAVVLPENGR